MKIFHHNDNDGKAAAAMIYYNQEANNILLNEDDFISVNYNNSIPTADKVNEDDIVFIVDYSFNKETVHDLYEISKKVNGNVYWFDHHLSSLDVYDKVKEDDICKVAIIDTSRSGARIVYDELIKNNTDVEMYLVDNQISITNIARIIELVDDYDRWIHNLPNSMLFNIGSQMVPNGPIDDIWISDPSNIILKGKTIKEYNDIKNSKLVKNNGYIVKINGYECIVLNTLEASSQSFAEYYDKYNFAIRWGFNGKNYSYSIYSGLEDINCKKIAQYFNPRGGGHKGSAGFVSDKLIFTDGLEFVI